MEGGEERGDGVSRRGGRGGDVRVEEGGERRKVARGDKGREGV